MPANNKSNKGEAQLTETEINARKVLGERLVELFNIAAQIGSDTVNDSQSISSSSLTLNRNEDKEYGSLSLVLGIDYERVLEIIIKSTWYAPRKSRE